MPTNFQWILLSFSIGLAIGTVSIGITAAAQCEAAIKLERTKHAD